MILVIGNLSWDRLVEVQRLPRPNQDVLIDRVSRFPGGAAGNVSSMLSLLGQRVNLLAAVGDDKNGQALAAEIAIYGVGVSQLKILKAVTSEFLVIMDPQGNRFFFLNPNEAALQLSEGMIQDIDFETYNRIAFVGCRLNLALKVTEKINTDKVEIFANMGFWIASQEINEKHIGFLIRTGCVFCNKQEFAQAPQQVKEALVSSKFLRENHQLILTAGNEPTTVYASSGSVNVPSFPLESIVNTLGCGDAFMGGYISGYIAGLDPQRCCNMGNQCATEIAKLPTERSPSIRLESIQGRAHS